MKLLANENFPLLAVAALRDVGHDVLWAGSDMRGAADDVILQRAQADDRLVVTFDKDFGAILRGRIGRERSWLRFSQSLQSTE